MRSSTPQSLSFSLATLLTLTQAQNGVLNDPSGTCTSLRNTLTSDPAFANVTVNFAEYLPAGTNVTFSQDYDLASCGYISQIITVDTCRVAMRVTTSNRSEITLEAVCWNPRLVLTYGIRFWY